MSSDNTKNYYTISLIFSLLAGILVLLTDFGGWTERGFYTTNYYVHIASENTPIYANILIALIGLSFLIVSYWSYEGLQGNLSTSDLNRAVQLSLILFIAIILGAILFMIQVEDAWDWWFDTGFYAGLIGAIVSYFFLNQNKAQ